MPPVVVIPVNRFDRAKGRLAEHLIAEQREALAVATFQTVAAAAREAGLLTVALTPDPERLKQLGAVHEVIGESAALHGLNEQLEGLIRNLAPEVLILHADLPLATCAAIQGFLEQATCAVNMVRSSDGGTNAMLLRPPDCIALAYGRNSFARHLEHARAGGVDVAEIDEFTLALDLDTLEDIERFLATPGAGETRAGAVLLSEAWRR